MQECYEKFHNIFITFWSVLENVSQELHRTTKTINSDTIRSKCMAFYRKLCVGFHFIASAMLRNQVPRKKRPILDLWDQDLKDFITFHNILEIFVTFQNIS